MDEEVIEGVLDGIDYLGDEADLPFAWDWDRVFNFTAPEAVSGENTEDDEEQPYAYQYEVGAYVILKPSPGAEAKFWLAQVVTHGEGDRRGEHEVRWMVATKAYGTYSKRTNADGSPFVDRQFAEGIQDDVQMIARDTRLSVMGQTTVSHWVDRWNAEEREEAGEEEEPEAVAARGAIMDID